MSLPLPASEAVEPQLPATHNHCEPLTAIANPPPAIASHRQPVAPLALVLYLTCTPLLHLTGPYPSYLSSASHAPHTHTRRRLQACERIYQRQVWDSLVLHDGRGRGVSWGGASSCCGRGSRHRGCRREMSGARHAAIANQRRLRGEEDGGRETTGLVHGIEGRDMGWHGWRKLVRR